ncbi:hypothetical protein CKO51_00140 [Rhodopirellula sp. SM50]|nr:suppressor of fused domain protein [Rhodopirellula sp. SM50]PAY21518.1 hypothetical protein CKO51_00140 [Rhodopirellula sp. SM50]
MTKFGIGKLDSKDLAVITKYIEEEFAGAKAVKRLSYPHGQDASRIIDVIRGEKFPKPEITSWCTIGLSNYSWESQDFPDRNELVGALKSSDHDYGMVLATVAHALIDLGTFPRPGMVMQEAVKMCELGELSEKMPHAMFVFPHTWGEKLSGTRIAASNVWMLQVVPIFDDEYRFIQKYSFEQFEEILVAKGVSFVNPGRQCCVV